jgi:hypothetical protein
MQFHQLHCIFYLSLYVFCFVIERRAKMQWNIPKILKFIRSFQIQKRAFKNVLANLFERFRSHLASQILKTYRFEIPNKFERRILSTLKQEVIIWFLFGKSLH